MHEGWISSHIRSPSRSESPVCVVLSSHLFRMSDLWDAPTGVTQEEGHTGFLHLPSAVLALILIGEGFSLPFPSSTVKSNVVYPRINRLRKNPSSCDCTEIRTHVPALEGFEVTN